jgi:hypothetical protein
MDELISRYASLFAWTFGHDETSHGELQSLRRYGCSNIVRRGQAINHSVKYEGDNRSVAGCGDNYECSTLMKDFYAQPSAYSINRILVHDSISSVMRRGDS